MNKTTVLRLVILIIVFLCLGLILNYFIGLKGKKVTDVKLFYNLKPGDTWKYKYTEKDTVMNLDNPVPEKNPSIYSTELTISQSVINIASDDVMDITATIDYGSQEQSFLGGQKTSKFSIFVPGTTVILTMGKNGKMLKVDNKKPNLQSEIEHRFRVGRKEGEKQVLKHFLLAEYAYLQPAFPEAALRIGDSWVDTLPLIRRSTFFDSQVTYTLQEFERIKGFDCAKIKVSYLTPISIDKKIPEFRAHHITKGKEEGEGVIYFAYKVGKIIEGHINAIMIDETVSNWVDMQGKEQVTIENKKSKINKIVEILP